MSGHGLVATGRARRVRRGWQWGVVAAAVAATGLVAPLAAGAAPTHDGVPTSVIVRSEAGHLHDAEAVVETAGGRIGRELSIIDGFTAVVPSDALATIADSAVVLSVSADAPLTPMSTDTTPFADASAGGPGGPGASAPSSTTNSLGSLSSVTRIIGAQDLWAAGYTGKGVDVALIDTGVAPVPGIDDHIVNGPDLSFDYQSGAPAGIDAYGHGTHMAGIIAGRDADASASSAGCTTCLNSSGYSDTTKFVGVAPDARIVNVKVGAFNGATDVSQVIAAIDWVVQHRNENGMNIRVLNLSFGTDSQQSYTIDPLAYAAEVAWRRGIVVVAAAGNAGPNAGSLSDPAYDPTILAVGASDSRSLEPPRQRRRGVLERRQRRPRRRRRGAGHAHRQPARPGLARRRDLPDEPGGHALHARLGHVAGRRGHVRLRRRPRAAVPRRNARPAEAPHHEDGDGHPSPERARRRQGHPQRHRHADEGQAHQEDPGLRAGDGHRLARSRTRLVPRARRRHPARR
jgi:hypothetical protein